MNIDNNPTSEELKALMDEVRAVLGDKSISNMESKLSDSNESTDDPLVTEPDEAALTVSELKESTQSDVDRMNPVDVSVFDEFISVIALESISSLNETLGSEIVFTELQLNTLEESIKSVFMKCFDVQSISPIIRHK